MIVGKNRPTRAYFKKLLASTDRNAGPVCCNFWFGMNDPADYDRANSLAKQPKAKTDSCTNRTADCGTNSNRSNKTDALTEHLTIFRVGSQIGRCDFRSELGDVSAKQPGRRRPRNRLRSELGASLGNDFGRCPGRTFGCNRSTLS